jgi:hypothetical protein
MLLTSALVPRIPPHSSPSSQTLLLFASPTPQYHGLSSLPPWHPSQRTKLLKEFKLGSCILIQGPIDRKNLHFAIEHVSARTIRKVSGNGKLAYVLALIKWVFNLLLRYCLGYLSRRRPGHQILVYCRRTKEVDDLRDQLIERGPDGLKCAAYHGKNSEERDAGFMEKWEKNCYDVVLATVGGPLQISCPYYNYSPECIGPWCS